MSKLIYVHDDDNAILDILLHALKENGYRHEYAVLSETPAAERIRTDMAFICTPATETTHLTMGNLTLDLDSVCACTNDGTHIHFTPIEFAMLSLLIKNAHRAVSREELLSEIWGYKESNNTRVADDTAKRLRRKLQDTNVVLETVWNFGFRVRTI